jgi:nicotinate-nucleotide adenylyltransferase
LIGIFGGMFDPVHCGHLRAMVELRDCLSLRELRVVPCANPVHRPDATAPPAARIAMLTAALRDMHGCVVDDREIRRGGASYTVDTLSELRHESADEALCLLVGHDAFTRLNTWHRWRDLFDLAHVVVARRPGTADAPLDPELDAAVATRLVSDAAALHAQRAGSVFISDTTELAISSTALRSAARTGRSLQWLVPSAVETLIETNDWYTGGTDG